ncbi:hypothetical protein [Calothrix sp. PCC 6303]|nr:hypothetical protein [Calothrix sp. PCC 6303]
MEVPYYVAKNFTLTGVVQAIQELRNDYEFTSLRRKAGAMTDLNR